MQFNSSSSYNMVENNKFNAPTNMTIRNSIVIDGISSHSSQTSNSLVQLDASDHNITNRFMSEYPMISVLQGEPSGVGFVSSDPLVSRSMPLGRNFLTDALLVSSRPNSETEFHDHFAEGTPISASSLATLLATRNCFQDNVNNLGVLSPSVFPSEIFRSYAPNDCTNNSNSSFNNTLNAGCDGVLGDMNSRWDFDKFPALPELAGKPLERVGFQPFRFVENLDPNGWTSSNNVNVNHDHLYSSKFSNELSLSLAMTQPSVLCGTAIPDQCSDRSSSGVTRHCLNETGFGSDQTSSNDMDLSLSFGSYEPPQFSQVISTSRYLGVVQEILAEIASYSLENLDQRSYLTGGSGTGANLQHYSSCFADRWISVTGSDEYSNGDVSETQIEPPLQIREIEAKKTQLLALLQVVDDRYNQCLDEVHTVISAFHAATELNPQVHARFALHTMSFLYKNLRERISNQILAMGPNHKSGGTKEKEGSTFETSFIQKQWALQQLRRKEHQLWRPQRGLPERSVSVLRAWMFQNFLHPYPKDAEKHLLAVKSGLTRSQVSNWFINARVRLWKPMIEEMYSEMNRRKARSKDYEGTENNRICSHINFDNQIYKLN